MLKGFKNKQLIQSGTKCFLCIFLFHTFVASGQQNQVSSKFSQQFSDSGKLNGKKIIAPLLQQKDSILSISKELIGIPGKLKPRFKVKDFSTSYLSPTSAILLPSQGRIGFLVLESNADFTLGGVPFQLNGQQNQLNNLLPTQTQRFWQMNFDKDLFIKNIKKRLSASLAEQLRQPFEKEIKEVKNQLLQSASIQLEKLTQNITGVNQSQFQHFKDPAILLESTTDQLEQQAEKFMIDSLKNHQLLLNQIESRIRNGETFDTTMVNQLKLKVNKFSQLHIFYEEIVKIKKSIDQSGLAEKLRQLQEESQKLIQEAQTNPAEIAKIATKYLPVKGMEKLFLFVEQMQTGQSVASFSRLSVNTYSLNGLNAGFQKGKNKLAVVAGNERMNGLFDQATLPFLQQAGGNIAGFRMGREAESGASTFISIFRFSQRGPIELQIPGNLPLPNSINTVNRFSTVFSLQTKMPITPTSNFEFEYARSFTRVGGNTPRISKSSGSLLSVLENAALDLKFDGLISDIGLHHKIHFSFVDLGFTNPGNPFLQRGLTEGSLDLRKDFFKKKIRIHTQANYRQFDYTAGTGGPSVKQFNFLLDIRGKFKRGQYINFRYQPNTNYRIAAGQSGIAGESNRLSLDGSFNMKIANKIYRHQLLVGVQESLYSGLLGTNVQFTSRFLNSIQQFSLQNFTIYCNTNYNKALNNTGSAFFNTSLMNEGGVQMNLSKAISGSAAIVYQHTQGFNEQVGTRLAIDGNIHPSLSLHIFTDLRFTTRTFTTDPLINNSNFDIKLQYHFKK
jgi:hypothetical protein